MGKKSAVFILILIALAVVSRLILLDLRVLHHDEGVNYFFAQNVLDGVYRYDPLNYHGPLYFFVLAFSFLIFGVSEFSLRFPAALAGVVLVVTPLFLIKGRARYWVSLFLLLSPSLMYYSRYSIHESLFVLFSFFGIYLFSMILERKNLSLLPYLALSLALLFAVKETFIILLLVFFFLLLFHWNRVKEVFAGETRQEKSRKFRVVILSIFLFFLVSLLLFTNFFSYWKGFADAFQAIMPWVQRGVGEVGHDKPFLYYFFLLLRYELPLVVLGGIGLWFASRSRDLFWRSCGLWFVLIFMIYNMIPYKTPWLIINISAPLALLAGFGVDRILERRRRIGVILLVIGCLSLFYFSYQVNFAQPWQSSNQFAYVHTYEDVLKLVDRVNGIEGKILVVFHGNEYWPLPFYFHGREVAYLSDDLGLSEEDYKSFFEEYGVLIVDEKILKEKSAPPGYFTERFRLRERVEAYVVRRV